MSYAIFACLSGEVAVARGAERRFLMSVAVAQGEIYS